MKNIILILLLMLSLAVVGYGQRSTTITPSTTETTDFGFKLSTEEQVLLQTLDSIYQLIPNCGIEETAKIKCDDLHKNLAKIYEQIARYPNLMRFLSARAVKAYESSKPYAKSAPQVSQIADQQNAELLRIIVMQNLRIIELLEQISKKK